MTRWLILTYGAVAYVIFLASFLYTVGFVGGLIVPKTIDSGPTVAPSIAILVDLILLSLFAVQHSTTASPIPHTGGKSAC